MKNRIVIIGGYGHVGQGIGRQLGERFPGRVYAAGRNAEQAVKFSESTGGQVLPMTFDLSQWGDESWFDSVKLVIMCLDQTDDAFVRACLRTGTHYLDISANGTFLSRLEPLHEEAARHGATAVLSLGLAPGLTNLLAQRAVRNREHTEQLDIAILLGLGDSHGKAAIEWTIDNILAEFAITEGGRKRPVASFSGGKRTDLGFAWGERMTYRFPFSDQQTLPRTLEVPGVSTRLCFDSRAVTGALALLRATGLTRLLRIPWVRRMAVRSFQAVKMGSDRFAVAVKGYSKDSGKAAEAEYFLEGANESLATARTAAAVAEVVYSADLPKGLFHIEQLFELEILGESIALKALGDDSGSAYPVKGVRFAAKA
jgi:saccharopine dehydrogenase-like NADP-dependent oxidoreductase